MNKRASPIPLFLLLFAPSFAPAQPRVAPHNLHERVWAVVPMTGSGTYEDPRRPLFAPVPGQSAAGGQPRILGYYFELSDDKRTALVEFWAPDRTAFREILGSSRPDVKAFERGKATKEEIESGFRKHKRDFDADKFARRGK